MQAAYCVRVCANFSQHGPGKHLCEPARDCGIVALQGVACDVFEGCPWALSYQDQPFVDVPSYLHAPGSLEKRYNNLLAYFWVPVSRHHPFECAV